MKRAILILLFLSPLPSCGFDEGGYESECDEDVCIGPDAGEGVDGGALRLGPPRVEVDLSRSVPVHYNQLAEAEGVEVAERDQAVEPTEETSPDELPVFEWEPDTAMICSLSVGSQCAGDISREPGCDLVYHCGGDFYCGDSSTCNKSPNSTCQYTCNYGYVCTANCNTGSPTKVQSKHYTCSGVAYRPKDVNDDELIEDLRFYHPGPDLKCGTADDPANCGDGKNPGPDRLCDDGSHPAWNDDNY